MWISLSHRACLGLRWAMGDAVVKVPHHGTSTPGATADLGVFQAAARPLFAGAAGRRPPGAASSTSSATQVLVPSARPSLTELAEGPYFEIASWLDASKLCCMDASSHLLRTLNGANGGSWRALGSRAYYGMELERDGIFDSAEQRGDAACSELLGGSRKLARIDWKGRFARFRVEVPSFRPPFTGADINTVRHPDEVAYCRCRLRTDLLGSSASSGVYLEVKVESNPDNLSLAVVDFEAGGRSSVTFSPDTGAVIRERKVREAPRKVEGAYIQPLATTPPGRRFEGSMGLYLHKGHLAFFRRCVTSDSSTGKPELDEWETTGFITDLSWAEGSRLTPCLAFRDEGLYRVSVVRAGQHPPRECKRSTTAYEESSWSPLDWEAGQPTPGEA